MTSVERRRTTFEEKAAIVAESYATAICFRIWRGAIASIATRCSSGGLA